MSATIRPDIMNSLRSSILILIDAFSHPDCRATLGQRLADFGRFPEPISTARETNEVGSGRTWSPGSRYSPLDQGPESQYDLSSSGQDGTTESAQRQHGRSAVSTLHIDGSALGRWAVQHLERALGKPATGMTGVDPRATIPRSRVAPF